MEEMCMKKVIKFPENRSLLNNLEKNTSELIELHDGLSRAYDLIQTLEDKVEEKEAEYNFLKNSTLTEENLTLKIGAYVMCIANLDLATGIANGTTGIIVAFTPDGNPLVKFDKHEKEVVIGKKEWKSENVPGISLYQIPLILAWGMTIHKAQGLTLEKAIIDIGSDLFEAGQMYVALSRLKSLDGLYLQYFNLNNLIINAKVLKFYETLI